MLFYLLSSDELTDLLHRLVDARVRLAGGV